jgi:hypothetical protein
MPMKKILSGVIFTFLIITLAYCAGDLPDNLFKSGDLTAGKGGIAGDGQVVDLDGNKVLKVDLSKNNDKDFYFPVSVRPSVKVLEVSFRVKGSDDYEAVAPSAGSLKIMFLRSNGSSTYIGKDVDKAWKTVNWKFNEINNGGSMKFFIVCRKGTGSIYFDDFVMKPIEK